MIHQDLAKLEAEGKPIRVGVSGAGWIGSGFVAQVAHVKGMRVSLLADTNLGAAREAFIASGVEPDDIFEAEEIGSAEDALRAGRRIAR
jgi:predicted homoserine dehydrogenase-like protein